VEKKNNDRGSPKNKNAGESQRKKVKTHNVNKDIKKLDKTLVAAEHIKRAYVKTRENAGQAYQQGQEHAAPVEYAEDKVSGTAMKAVHKNAYQVKKQGKKLACTVNEKRRTAKELKRERQEEGKKPPANANEKKGLSSKEETCSCQSRRAAQGDGGENSKDFLKQNIKAKEYGKKTIKSPQMGKTVKYAGKGTVKNTGRTVKTAERSAKAAIKTTEQTMRTSKTAVSASVKMSQKSAKVARVTAKATATAIKTTVKTAVAATKAIIAGTKALIAAIAAGGWIVIMILVIVLVFGGVFSMVGGDNSATVSSVSKEVQAYEPIIQKYAIEYGVGEYVELIKAVMMQESGGKGNDPMQSSQCSFNQKYDRKANGITDPEYSIECGIQELKRCLADAEVENPLDMQHIKLGLQGYNYGNGYISWAKKNYGGYTTANAIEFSDTMAEKKGWDSYGDKQYVPHVLRYYAFGRIPSGIGNQAIVQVALTQEGNSGDIYWSWYGFSNRVEWCACFVSWCSEQCGYLENGLIPKFSLCSDGAEWFASKGQFQDGSYVPAAGDIIFFDWKNDGTIDHVGIVESVADGVINTIEGNSKDKVRRRSYPIGSNKIYGYGVPQY